MRNPIVSACFLACFFVFSSLTSLAQQPQVSIQILATFDYPGEGNSTLPQKINDRGDIVGFFRDSTGTLTRGFIRFRNGTFSPPIVEPNDTGNDTQARGINNLGEICGFYVNATVGFFHGFFFSGTSFSEFDVPGAANTDVHALNNEGDFAGSFATTSEQAFLDIGGSVTPVTIPGATQSAAFTINNSDQIAGEYLDEAFISHGFFRDGDGTLTFPIDPPGATSTIVFGINDQALMVGRYDDGSGVSHGFLFQRPDKFLVFDYPGATFTSLNGINRGGVICGRYQDSAGVGHGIIARVKRGRAIKKGAENRPPPIMPGEQLQPASRELMMPE